jgi:signal transduction histidine kinase
MNETPKPAVSVSLTTTTREGEAGPDDPTEVVEIRSVDDGPGIPPHEIAR